MRAAMRVLAIDPGYDRLGIAVVEGDPSRPTVVWSDCVLPAAGAKEKRLAQVADAVATALSAYAPDVLALEKLFFSTNKKTAFGVAEARGAILVAAAIASVPVKEYSPQEVKLAVTGYGNANKTSIAEMLPRLLTLPKKKRLDDEFDAIAIGVTALAEGGRRM